MTTLSDKVRVIFPDGLPGGVDASQVKLMIQRQPNAQQSRNGNGAAANNPTIAAQNKPEPVPSDPRPATPPPSQDESQPLAAGACPATHPPAQAEPDPDPAPSAPCTPTPPHAQNENDSVPLSPAGLLPSTAPRTRAEVARENGRKSRGPITPEGKARSSQNALKHGLSSRQIVIETEDEEEWLEFRDECRQTFRPVGAIELGYADEFAASRWRLNRCLGIETSIFDHEFAMQKIYDEKRCSEMDDLAKTGKAFRSAQDNLSALGRYETRIRRSGERALTNLLKLQSMRQNKPNQADEPEAPDGHMLQLVPSGGESTAQNEPGPPGVAAEACPPTETQEAERTQATGHNPEVPLPSAFGILHSSSAAAPVREPAPQPVQPSASSAVVLQNEPTDATGHDPVQPSASSAPVLQNEPTEVTAYEPQAPPNLSRDSGVSGPLHPPLPLIDIRGSVCVPGGVGLPPSSSAAAPVREPAPRASSAAFLQNQPETRPALDDSAESNRARPPQATR